MIIIITTIQVIMTMIINGRPKRFHPSAAELVEPSSPSFNIFVCIAFGHRLGGHDSRQRARRLLCKWAHQSASQRGQHALSDHQYPPHESAVHASSSHACCSKPSVQGMNVHPWLDTSLVAGWDRMETSVALHSYRSLMPMWAGAMWYADGSCQSSCTYPSGKAASVLCR